MSRILLVDDDRDLIDLVRCSLGGEHRVFFAENAFDAIDLLEVYRFDLLIIDIELPLVNGFQLIQKIDSIWKNSIAPVLMISSRNQKKDILRAKKLGVDSYLLKPFDKKQLSHKVESILALCEKINPPISVLPTQSGAGTLTVTKSIQVESINEEGILLISNCILEADKEVILSCTELDKLGFTSLKMRVYNCEKIEEKIFRSYLQFKYQDARSIVKKIKSYLPQDQEDGIATANFRYS